MNMNKLKLNQVIEGLSAKTIEDALVELKGLNDTLKTSVDTLKTDTEGVLTEAEAATLVKGVEYDATTLKITFTMFDNSTKEINLPKDSTVKSGKFDTTTNEIVLVLSDEASTEIRIPATSLIDVYTGVDGDKIKVEVSDDNAIKASIKTGTIEKTDLVQAVQDKIDEIDTIKTNVTTVEGKVTTLETDNTTNKSDISKLKTDVTANANAISDANTSIETVEGKVTALETDNTANKTAISNLQTAVGSNEEGGTGITKEIADLKTSVSNINKALNGEEGESGTTGITDRVTAVETDVSTLKTDNTTNKTDIASLKTDNTTNKTDISKLKTDVSTNATDIDTLETTIGNMVLFSEYATGKVYKKGTPVYTVRDTGDLIYLCVATKEFTASTFDADVANKNLIRVGIPNEYYEAPVIVPLNMTNVSYPVNPTLNRIEIPVDCTNGVAPYSIVSKSISPGVADESGLDFTIDNENSNSDTIDIVMSCKDESQIFEHTIGSNLYGELTIKDAANKEGTVALDLQIQY